MSNETPLGTIEYPERRSTRWFTKDEDGLELWLEQVELLGIPTYATFADVPDPTETNSSTFGGTEQNQLVGVAADKTVYRSNGSDWVAFFGHGTENRRLGDVFRESITATQASVESQPTDGTDVARKTEVDEKTDQTEFDDHSARHESGGIDEVSVEGLSGDLADAQDPKQSVVNDFVDALLSGGSNITTTYDDTAGTLTIDTSALNDDEVRDTINDTLVGGGQVTTTYDDTAGTVTIDIDAPTQAEFDDHSARHEPGGSDVLSLLAEQISDFGTSVIDSISGSEIAPSAITDLWNGTNVTANVNNQSVNTEYAGINTVDVLDPSIGQPEITISEDPANQHKFSPVQTDQIEVLGLSVDGAERSFLAYDSSVSAADIRLYYTDSLDGDGQWEAYSENPVLSDDGRFRWPSVTTDGSGTLHMYVEDQTVTNRAIDRFTSADGIDWTYQETVVPSDEHGQAPNIWQDPISEDYVLLYTSPNSAGAQLRRAATPGEIADATPTSVGGLADAHHRFSQGPNRATPTISYYDGRYWLYTEKSQELAEPEDDTTYWLLYLWTSETLDDGYVEAGSSPFIGYGEDHGAACPTLVRDGMDLYLFWNAHRGLHPDSRGWKTRHTVVERRTVRPAYSQDPLKRQVREVRSNTTRKAGLVSSEVWDGTQSIPSGSWTEVEWDTRHYRDETLLDDPLDTGTNAMTVQRDGYYTVDAAVEWDDAPTIWDGDAMQMRFIKNPNDEAEEIWTERRENHQGSAPYTFRTDASEFLDAGDAVVVEVWQDTGESADLLQNDRQHNRFEVTRENIVAGRI